MRPGAAVRSVAKDSSDPYRSLREMNTTIGWTSSCDGELQEGVYNLRGDTLRNVD